MRCVSEAASVDQVDQYIRAISGYCIEAMTHESALLLAADQTQLAEHDLLAPVTSLVRSRDAPVGIIRLSAAAMTCVR